MNGSVDNLIAIHLSPFKNPWEILVKYRISFWIPLLMVLNVPFQDSQTMLNPIVSWSIRGNGSVYIKPHTWSYYRQCTWIHQTWSYETPCTQIQLIRSAVKLFWKKHVLNPIQRSTGWTIQIDHYPWYWSHRSYMLNLSIP